MSKHLADHRVLSNGGRLKHFLRLARDRSEAAWQMVRRSPRDYGATNQRAVQYARIERGRQA